MKKKILLTMVLSMVVAVAAGCASDKDNKAQETGTQAKETQSDAEESQDTTSDKVQDTDKTDDSLEYIINNGKLILGLDSSFPPMGFLDDDQNIVGFDIDVAKEVAKRMGVELELQPINWEAKEMEISSKNIDCIWNGMSVNEERKAKHTLSESYMLNEQVIVVAADSDVTTREDLAGKAVVIQNASTAQDAVEENVEFKDSLGELIKVEDNIKAMLDLTIGASDAVVMDAVVAKYYMELDANKGQFRILDGSLSDEEYTIGFRKGDIALCNEVNRILEEMAADGTLASISESWFGEDITLIGK